MDNGMQWHRTAFKLKMASELLLFSFLRKYHRPLLFPFSVFQEEHMEIDDDNARKRKRWKSRKEVLVLSGVESGQLTLWVSVSSMCHVEWSKSISHAPLTYISQSRPLTPSEYSYLCSNTNSFVPFLSLHLSLICVFVSVREEPWYSDCAKRHFPLGGSSTSVNTFYALSSTIMLTVHYHFCLYSHAPHYMAFPFISFT